MRKHPNVLILVPVFSTIAALVVRMTTKDGDPDETEVELDPQP